MSLFIFVCTVLYQGYSCAWRSSEGNAEFATEAKEEDKKPHECFKAMLQY